MEQCIQPGVVTDDDLVAYAHGEADQLTAEHVRACPACAAAAGEYAGFDRRLGQLFHRIDCPPAETLVLAERRRLPPAEHLRVAAHLRTCSRCAAEAEAIRDPPAADPLPSIGLGERLRRVVATLLTLPPEAAYAGVRGAGDASSRTYQADNLLITVHLSRSWRGGRQLSGLIWQEDDTEEAFTGSTTRLISSDGPIAVALVDEGGGFVFEAVGPGTYRLEIERQDAVVVLEDLRLER